MPVRRFLLPLAAAALLAGCGDRHLVLRVDVLSFIAPADRQTNFGPIPAVPGGVATGEVALVDNADVSLLQGLGGWSPTWSARSANRAIFWRSDAISRRRSRVTCSR